jgi:formamidopyrimidine-DNA glycosylase
MPELPEVQTIVKGLNEKVLQGTFLNVWTDTAKIIKKIDFEDFKKQLKGKKIEKIYRRGKNIIFNLSEGFSLLIHLKMTGHFLYGNWRFENNNWVPLEKEGPLLDEYNKYIHVLFYLDNGKMLAFSDLRKFAKIEFWKTENLEKSKELQSLGPEPLSEDFTFKVFRDILNKKKRGKIKQVLMDQEIIAGIGNIYSDEILWLAKVNPFKDVSLISDKEAEDIFDAIKNVLMEALESRGTSISDYRDIEGKKGKYGDLRRVYRREGEECLRCGSKIERKMIGQRSTHFCPLCQKL